MRFLGPWTTLQENGSSLLNFIRAQNKHKQERLFLAVVVCKAPETLKCCFSLIEVICFGWAREGLIP